jgi:hypothetical protein
VVLASDLICLWNLLLKPNHARAVIGDRIHLSDEMLIALRRERAVLTAFPDGVPPNEHLARVLMREDRIAQVCANAPLVKPSMH